MSALARHIAPGLVAVALLLSGLAHGDNPPVAIDDAGRAIRGYDAVAYFEDGQPQPGSAAFSHDWKGAVWLFASAANRDAFAANPKRYTNGINF